MATSVERAPGLPASLNNFSFRAQWAAQFIREDLGRIQSQAKAVPTESADKYHLLPIANTRAGPETSRDAGGFRVGIIGAGVAGLFTAMLFDYLNEKYPGLNIKYELIEAEKERIGGRLFTYTFPERAGQPKIGLHDYYDVGAMRFPDVDTMKRTFALFNTLGMNHVNPQEQTPQPGDLIPYKFAGPNQPALYNGIQVVQSNGLPALSAATFEVPDIPLTMQNTAASQLIDDQIAYLMTMYKNEGGKVFWNELRKKVDPYSVRQYFTTQVANPLDYKTLEFCETLNFGNRWYDQAASEMVLESLDFDSKAEWWCVEGGAAEIAKRMKAQIKHQDAIMHGKLVTGISYNTADIHNVQVDLKIAEEESVRTYDAVFNSAPLGAMQHMHLEGLNLNWGTKSAIRSLGYGASCKVGIRFRSLWWMSNGLDITGGGQGKTDLPIRCCVYPSYNLYDDRDQPGVLLVSYTWSQEAERIGALIDKKSPEDEDELKALLFHDLARLHSPSRDNERYKELYKIIEDNYLDHYAYDWYKNPRTVGAFAYFGPGQFSNWYSDLTKSDGKHVIIGEAASAHHAWVVGALESAVRGVYQFLWKHSAKSAQAAEATEAYNKNQIPAPFGPIPDEYNRDEDIQLPRDAKVQPEAMPSSTGEFARMQVLMESIRLKQGGDVIDPDKITKAQIIPILDVLKG